MVFVGIYTLKSIKKFLPIHMKLLLVLTLIFPNFNYCNSDFLMTHNCNAVRLTQNIPKLFHLIYLRSQAYRSYHTILGQIQNFKIGDLRSIKTQSLLHSCLEFLDLPLYLNRNFESSSLQSSRNTFWFVSYENSKSQNCYILQVCY